MKATTKIILSLCASFTTIALMPPALHAEEVASNQPKDAAPAPFTEQFITVDDDVKLQVVDWGGIGRSLVLLTGLGDQASVFNALASKLTDKYHVYGVTRRGFAPSSIPESGYSADRLGDDVVAVIEALKLNRPILVGHSIAGEELSSLATRHPEKVAGLIYLEAAYAYAFYDPSDKKGLPTPRLAPGPSQKIWAGREKFTDIRVPVLAIFAEPNERFARVVERDAPSARIVQLTQGSHYVFRSNEADVLREMNAFIATLP